MRPFSRRAFLRAGAAVATGAALAPRVRAQSGAHLDMVWWGESEAVGIQKWIDDTSIGRLLRRSKAMWSWMNPRFNSGRRC